MAMARALKMTPFYFRQIRISMKLTQSEMAEYLGIKRDRTVRAWELGERKVPRWAIKILEKRKC